MCSGLPTTPASRPSTARVIAVAEPRPTGRRPAPAHQTQKHQVSVISTSVLGMRRDSVDHLVPSPRREMARPAVISDHGGWHKRELALHPGSSFWAEFPDRHRSTATNSDTRSGHRGPVLTAVNGNAIRTCRQAHLAAKGRIATFLVGIHPCRRFPADSWSGFPAHQLALGRPQGPAAYRRRHLRLGPDHLLRRASAGRTAQASGSTHTVHGDRTQESTRDTQGRAQNNSFHAKAT